MPDVIFNGPEGRIEGRYHHNQAPTAPIALVLHPHPQHGGTLNSKVVYHLFHTFVRRGFCALRFNFRGVGRSEGRYDGGQGELADAAAALDWVQSHNTGATGCWIAGFSFGAWISMQLLMRRPEISGYISVAPPANIYDFTFLSPCPTSGLIVHGSDDAHVPPAEVAKLAERLAAQRLISVTYSIVGGASHFFENHLDQLDSLVGDYLDSALSPAAAS